MTSSNFLPRPIFLLLHPLPRSLKRPVHRIGASDVGPRSTVRHRIVDPHWAVVSPDRMRGEATFHPICRGVVLGNTESGRRWRWNEGPLSLFSDGFAPSCHHIWRQYTEYALATLEDDAVEIEFLRLNVIDHIRRDSSGIYAQRATKPCFFCPPHPNGLSCAAIAADNGAPHACVRSSAVKMASVPSPISLRTSPPCS
jgi:hypothetical protein